MTAPCAHMQQLQDKFEAWVGNPHMLNRYPMSDEYEHPWTQGAWAAWCYLHPGDLAKTTQEKKERRLVRGPDERYLNGG